MIVVFGVFALSSWMPAKPTEKRPLASITVVIQA